MLGYEYAYISRDPGSHNGTLTLQLRYTKNRLSQQITTQLKDNGCIRRSRYIQHEAESGYFGDKSRDKRR